MEMVEGRIIWEPTLPNSSQEIRREIFTAKNKTLAFRPRVTGVRAWWHLTIVRALANSAVAQPATADRVQALSAGHSRRPTQPRQ